MKSLHKSMSLILALVLSLALFAGCKTSSSSGGSQTSSGDPLKISAVHIMNENPTAPGDNTLVDLTRQNVTNAVGRDVQVEWVTYPKDEMQINEWLRLQDAGGTLPDLCYLLNLPFEDDGMSYVASKELFHEFTPEIIREKMPNYARRVEELGFGVDEIFRTNSYVANGKMYGLPIDFRADTFPANIKAGMREYPNYGYYFVLFRDDILKDIYPDAKSAEELMNKYAEQGSLTIQDFANDIPIENLEELEAYMMEVKKRNYKVGEKTVIPGALVSNSESPGSLTNSLQTAMGIGWRWPVIWTDNLEESYFLRQNEEIFKPYVKWWNKIYHEGLIDPELFIMKNDQYGQKASNGEYAIINPGIPGALQAAIDLGKERGYGWRPFPVFFPVDMSILSNRVQYISVRSQQVFINKSVQGEELEAMYKYLDYFMSEQADDISAWGHPDWYTGEGADRRYKPEYEDLVNWSVYGASGEKDGAYYGITAGIAADYTNGANRQLNIRPVGLIQPSDAATPTAPYYIYPRDNKEMLKQASLFNIATQAGWDWVLDNVDRYAKIGWQESDYDSPPSYQEYESKIVPEQANNLLIQAIHGEEKDFDTNFAAYIKMHEDAGIRQAEADIAKALKEVWEKYILPNKIK